MALTVNTNIAAINAYRNLSVTNDAMTKSMQRLSSGYRINTAADDAAGLAISEGLKSQIGGLTVAVRNTQDGISVAQTAEGALNETTSILQRMRDLSVQAANGGSNDPNAQAAANQEFTQLKSELDRIQSTTAFGGQKLLNGSYTGTFQVGANNTGAEQIKIDLTSSGALSGSGITGLDSAGLGLSGDQGRLDRARVAGCHPEPLRAHDQQPQRRDPEHHGGQQPDRRHRHGLGDDQLLQEPDPGPGRHGDARPGERRLAERAQAARLIDPAGQVRGEAFGPPPSLLCGPRPAGPGERGHPAGCQPGRLPGNPLAAERSGPPVGWENLSNAAGGARNGRPRECTPVTGVPFRRTDAAGRPEGPSMGGTPWPSPSTPTSRR
jgi:hypothetical protein